MHSLEVTDYSVRLPDGTPLLDHIHHTFTGRTGLVGPNGAGKSTLLAHLAAKPGTGFLRQSAAEAGAGRVVDALGLAAEWAALRRSLAGDASAGDLARLEGWWDLEERVAAVFARLGFAPPLDAAMARLSGGEQVRVRLAALLLRDPAFLLLDEPTNHLDAAGRRFVRDFVTGWPRGLVVASHDRALLMHVDTIAELAHGSLRAYGGNYAFYRDAKAREREAAAAALQSARETVRLAERDAREAAARQAKRQSRGRKDYLENGGMPRVLAGLKKRNAEKTAARLQGSHEERVAGARAALDEARAKVTEPPGVHVDLGAAAGERRRLVTARELQLCPPGGRPLFRAPLDFVVHAGDRLALAGPNGGGKTTLLRALAGEVAPCHGELNVAARRTAYLSQHAENLALDRTILENVRREAPGAPEHELRIRLARLGFPNDAVFKEARVLSGGERVRAALACLLAADEAPDLLLLDEPDNHLDLAAQEAVAAALRTYAGALVVVSHDPAFLEDAGVAEGMNLGEEQGGP